MSIWLKSLLSGLVITSFIFLISYKIIPQRNKPLFKVHYIVELSSSVQLSRIEREDMMARVPVIIKRRITNMGYKIRIGRSGDKTLDMTFENVDDTSLTRQVVTQNNKLEFRELYTLNELPVLFTIADEATHKILDESQSIYSILSPLIPNETRTIAQIPSAVGAVHKKDTAILNQILRHSMVLQALPADLQFNYGPLTDETAILNTPDDLHLYAIRTRREKAKLQNEDIEDVKVQTGRYNDQPEILFQFNNIGSKKWAKMTRDNVGKYLAIIFDDVVVTAPLVHSPIEGGQVSLSGGFTLSQANALAQQLKAGLLSADLLIIDEEISNQSTPGTARKFLTTLIIFILTAGLAFFVFNTLNNN
jgi:hypothetical protein